VKRIPIRRVNEMLFDDSGEIGWGHNGGFQAINVATRFGSRRILLCGFDLSLEKGVHFHGSHPSPLTNPSAGAVESWRGYLDAQAQLLADHGVEVINCSPHSRLANYRRQPLLEALAYVRDLSTGR
jgi:hypothetical protein